LIGILQGNTWRASDVWSTLGITRRVGLPPGAYGTVEGIAGQPWHHRELAIWTF
jgi:hypothetical protein